MVPNCFAKFSMFSILLTIENCGSFFHDFIIQNLLVAQKNVLIQMYAENIEFWWIKKNVQNC